MNITGLVLILMAKIFLSLHSNCSRMQYQRHGMPAQYQKRWIEKLGENNNNVLSVVQCRV